MAARNQRDVAVRAATVGVTLSMAAGIALMGQARGQYTFFTHLRWTPAIALGYVLSIWLHMVLNKDFGMIMPGG